VFKLISIIILVLLNTLIFAFDNNKIETNAFFTKDEINLVQKGEIISRMYMKYNVRGENTHMSIEIPKTKYSEEDYDEYEILSDEKAFIPYNLNDSSKLKFYNYLTSFSNLKGMEYYSRSAGKIETLILDCYRIESPQKNMKINDNLYKEINPSVTNYFFQEANKIGSLIYQSDLFNEGDNFIMVNTCAQPIKELMFDINNSGEYKIKTFFVYDKEKKGFFYYSFLAMRVRADVVIKNPMILKPTTFANRLRAGTVHIAKLMGVDFSKKLNPWDETKLKNGEYRNY